MYLYLKANYFKSYNTQRLLQNQGFHYHFAECENRMWLISERKLPIGIQFELANDWVMLHYSYINYFINSKDEYLVYLKNLLFDSIMSPEVCFFFNLFLFSCY